MRDFPRMVDEGADEFEAGLLRSADRDAGDERALARTLAAMGVAVLASTALRAAGSAAAQGPAPGLSAGQALEAGQGTAQANGSAALSGGAGGSAPLAGASGIRSFASSSVASGVAGLIIGIVLALGVPMVADGAGGQPASVLVASRMPHLRGVDAEVVAPPAPEPAPPPAEVIGPELPARRPEPAPTSPAASGKATSPDGASGRSEVSLGASPEATTSPATPQVMVGVRGVSLSEEVKMLDRARAS